MAYPIFTLQTTTELSTDTDSGRANDYPSIIRDSSGRLMVFYEKQWKSGRLTNGFVTAVSGFDIQVAAGTGEINSISVTWLLTNLTVPPSSYSLIYVTNAGVVSQTTDITETLVKDSIVLAFVGSGGSAVAAIEMVETNGTYVFHKKQVWNGSAWVWDDYEYRLNVGINPTAFYDSANNKAYLSFSREGSSFSRVLDFVNPLTFEYLPHYRLTADILYPEPQISKTSISRRSGGNSQQVITNVLFPLSAIGAGFSIGTFGIDRVIRVPYLSSQFNSYVIEGSTYCEVFEKIAGSYVLVDSFPIKKIDLFDWAQFTDTPDKTYYLGIRLKHTLYSEDEFATDPSQYYTMRVYANQTSFESVYGLVYGPNVALGKTSAQSSEYPGYPASNAFDGNINTFSHSGVTAPGEWLKVDLGASFNIARVLVGKRRGYVDRPTSFKIQSADDYAFTVNVVDRYSVSGDYQQDAVIDFTVPFAARYVRLIITAAEWINIAEFEVRELVGTGVIQHNARCDEVLYPSRRSGGQSNQSKTAEYDQVFKFQDDGPLLSRSSGSQSTQAKTAEFDQLFTFQDDGPFESRVSGSSSILTQTS